MEEKELTRLLRQYMPAGRTLVGEPDPLLVIEARLMVSARKERGRLYTLRTAIGNNRTALRQLAAGIVFVCFAAGFLWLDGSHRRFADKNSDTSTSVMTASLGTSTLSAISSTLLTSIPTLRN